jgi:predicted transposase YbfD/YdcC
VPLAGRPVQQPVPTAAVDGKTSKQGHDADGDPIHVLNVFAHEARICLAQWIVGDGKATEREVHKAHLGELFAAYPALRLLTGDALFCQRPLVRLIVAAGRDYLIAVKDNQPNLHEIAQTAFADATAETADAGTRKKRDAVVTRRLWLDAETADYARQALSFPGLRLLLRVDSETRVAGVAAKTETRYFATSVDPGRKTADELLAAVRGHWQVENGLHFIKDRWWDEDHRYSTRPRVALGFAVLLNAVVTVLRAGADSEDSRPLRARAGALAWDVEQAIELTAGKKL